MEYEKDFDKWNKIKKKVDSRKDLPYFDVNEIWWAVAGVNVGIEIDGKGDDFLRPVLILNKYNQFGCLIIPLTSARIVSKDNIYIGIVEDKIATANMSQIKSISSKRLIEKIKLSDKIEFTRIQKAVMEYNFPKQLSDIPSPENPESSQVMSKADIN